MAKLYHIRSDMVQSLPGMSSANPHHPSVSHSPSKIVHFVGDIMTGGSKGRHGGVCSGFSGILSGFPPWGG